MIICDAAMILFTFDLNHSQNFRPHRKKKKNLHPHTASGGALTLRSWSPPLIIYQEQGPPLS